jgi:cell division protein FtsB
MNTNRRKQVNPVHLSSLIRWLLVAAFIGASGLCFVYIKNQQFALAEEIRQMERRIANVRALNETLLARVTKLSSRQMLQQRIAEGFISMKPIQDNVIARLSPPVQAAADGVLRTAFNEGIRQ